MVCCVYGSLESVLLCEAGRVRAEQFCIIRSYISTIRKQCLGAWQALGSTFSADILLPQLTSGQILRINYSLRDSLPERRVM